MFWAVMCLQKEISLNGVGIPLDKEDGFEGYIPVFKTKPAALKHTGGKFFIIPMALGKEKITRRKKMKIAKDLPRPNPLHHIRKHCNSCSGGSGDCIKFCPSVNCDLWLLRFGFYPSRYVNHKGDSHRILFDKKQFSEGGLLTSEFDISKVRENFKEHCEKFNKKGQEG